MNDSLSPSQPFFLYARKSTDVEDKQVLSIDGQLAELREFAQKEHLSIIGEYIEKQSAKIPGRPLFNEMMSKVHESKEPIGIIAWHPFMSTSNIRHVLPSYYNWWRVSYSRLSV